MAWLPAILSFYWQSFHEVQQSLVGRRDFRCRSDPAVELGDRALLTVAAAATVAAFLDETSFALPLPGAAILFFAADVRTAFPAVAACRPRRHRHNLPAALATSPADAPSRSEMPVRCQCS
jgi:hypothetical protein